MLHHGHPSLAKKIMVTLVLNVEICRCGSLVKINLTLKKKAS